MGFTEAAMAAGAVVSAFGTLQAGKAAAASGKYNNAVAANNAEIARRNAEFAGQKGEAAAARKQMETRAKVGGILASQGASGVNINSESAGDVRESATELGKLDALTIRSNAAREAYGYQTQGMNYDAEGALALAEGKNAQSASYLTAASTLLTGAGNAYGAYTSNNAINNPSLTSGSNNGFDDWQQ